MPDDCEHPETERYNQFYEDGRLVEYSICCIDCGRKTATWSYGEWLDVED